MDENLNMSTTKATTSIKYSKGSLDIVCQFNKRLIGCFMYLKFKTSEKSLLYNLLVKYIHEKIIGVGCNAVNEIYSAKATTNGILISCSEKKIIPNIINIYAYLMKTKLSSKEVKNLCCQQCDYDKLHSDIVSFSVYITGKVRNLLKALQNKTDKKIDKIAQSLDNVEPKPFGKCENKQDSELIKLDYKSSPKEKLDLALLLEDTPFTFDGDKLVAIDKHTLCEIDVKFKYDYALGKIKNFFNSCGSPGSPAANDNGQVKYKAKCEYILECLNMLCLMVSDLHGFTYKLSNVEDLKKVSPTSESRDKMKTLHKQIMSMH